MQLFHIFLSAFPPGNEMSLIITERAIKGIQIYEGIKEIVTLKSALDFRAYRMQPLNKTCELLFKISYIGTAYMIVAQPSSSVSIELATIAGWGLNAWLIQRKMQQKKKWYPRQLHVRDRCELIQSSLEVLSNIGGLAKKNSISSSTEKPTVVFSFLPLLAILAKIAGICYILLNPRYRVT